MYVLTFGFVCYTYISYPLTFLLMPKGKDQQSHSMDLVLAYLIFATTIFRLHVFKFYDLLFSLRISE